MGTSNILSVYNKVEQNWLSWGRTPQYTKFESAPPGS